ncbi:unnamed protein product, partial [Didymodactylos carnosus]
NYIERDDIKIIKQLDQSVFVLEKHKQHENHVVQVCNNIYTETTKKSDYAFQKSMITKTLTDQLANYMTNRLNSELINPAVHAGVDGIVENLANKIEVACAGSNGTLKKQLERRRAQNAIIRQGKDMMKQAAKEQAKGTKAEYVHGDPSIHPDIEKMAQNAEQNTPGSLMEVMALSAKLGRPVHIMRNGKYDLTIGDTQAGEPLKLDYLENKTGGVGHFGNENPNNAIQSTGPTNCLYDRLSEQTNISSDELRQLAANGIRENSNHYLKMMPAADLLAQHGNKGLLYIGGTNKAKKGNQSTPPVTKNNKTKDVDEERHVATKNLTLPENTTLKSAMGKFINAFNVDQIHAGGGGTLFGYNKERHFRDTLGEANKDQFFDSLNKKEENLIVAPKGLRDKNDSRGTLRLDNQGVLGDNRLNLQIQYGGDRQRLEQIRSAYADTMKNAQTTTTTTNADDRIKLLAKGFPLIDDEQNLAHLKLCVIGTHLEIACQAILGEYLKILIEQQNARKANSPSVPPTIVDTATKSTVQVPESLSKIMCQILVKKNQPAVIEFIQSFLLSPLAKAASRQKPNVLSSTEFIGGPIPPGTTLDIFIRAQLLARGGTIDLGRPLTKLPLVEPIVLVDEFDTWHFDRLRGLFELNLVNEPCFPQKWTLAPDGELFYIFETPADRTNTNQAGEQTVRNVDRPSTQSLEQFVTDICEKENNGMASKWLTDLRADDLFSYDHLANLKFTEWDRLKQLSMNGRKTLKSYVDREKQMASDAKTTANAQQSNSNKGIRE